MSCLKDEPRKEGSMKIRIERMISFLQSIWGRAIDIIYPPCCPFCDLPLEKPGGLGICTACQREIVYITERYCLKCGKALLQELEEYCWDCRRHSHYYEQARAILSYQKKTKEALYRFKKSNRQEYAAFFGKEICRLLGRWLYNLEGDYLIPIPLYKKNERARGYNQAELLANEIGAQLQIPVGKNILQKIQETKQQKDLGRADRRKNLESVFWVPPEGCRIIKGKRIILVDDIYTTGATVDAAARMLKKSGAKEVYVVTVAIGG